MWQINPIVRVWGLESLWGMLKEETGEGGGGGSATKPR
jgi:hypothetical protein